MSEAVKRKRATTGSVLIEWAAVDGVRFNKQQTNLLEKILDKLLEMKEILDGIHVNCKRM